MKSVNVLILNNDDMINGHIKGSDRFMWTHDVIVKVSETEIEVLKNRYGDCKIFMEKI